MQSSSSEWSSPKGHQEQTKAAKPYAWPSLDVFRRWYLEQGFPLAIPPQATVFRTDIASAVTLYRHGQFSVELYLIDRPELVDHAHPSVELIQMFPLGSKDSVANWHVNDLLPAGKRHGASDETTVPPVMLVFERWISREPTSVSVDWEGPILGPIHRDLLKKHSPQTRIINGVAQ